MESGNRAVHPNERAKPMPVTDFDPGEVRLLTRLKAGDRSALAEILARYEGRVFSLVRGLTADESAAQDALQEAFLSVLSGMDTGTGEAGLSARVYRAAVRAALRKGGGRGKGGTKRPAAELQPVFDGRGHRVAAVPDWHPLVDRLLQDGGRDGPLRAWIAGLEPLERAALVLRDQEWLDIDEVARVLERDAQEVRSSLHRARLCLRERAKRHVYSGA